jgi:hypothetical protein
LRLVKDNPPARVIVSIPSKYSKTRMHDLRRSGTRVNCEIAVRLDLVDSIHSLSGSSLIILVNPRGCAARFTHPLGVGTRVRLEGLPEKGSVTARVVNCVRPEASTTFCILGLSLDEPGNVWGIETPPQDWNTTTRSAEGLKWDRCQLPMRSDVDPL